SANALVPARTVTRTSPWATSRARTGSARLRRFASRGTGGSVLRGQTATTTVTERERRRKSGPPISPVSPRAVELLGGAGDGPAQVREVDVELGGDPACGLGHEVRRVRAAAVGVRREVG